VLEAAAAHLAVPMSAGEAAEIVAGPLFATYSKNPEQPFDNEARLARRSALEAPLAEELVQARRWVESAGGESALASLESKALLAGPVSR
jgi:hypothetical protein